MVIARADVTLVDQLGNAVATATAINGEFRIPNVSVGSYSLRADAPPFQALVQTLTVSDALPIRIELKLSAALAEQVNVTAESSQPATTATRTTLAGDAIRRAPIRISSRGLQDAVATTPGWTTEDNGLMHARGVDDGFLLSRRRRADVRAHGQPARCRARSGNGRLGQRPRRACAARIRLQVGWGDRSENVEPAGRLVARKHAVHGWQRRDLPGFVGVWRTARPLDGAHAWRLRTGI